MKTISDKHDIALRNVGFSAFLCAGFGFIVLEAGLILAKAQPRAQVISVLTGAVVMVLIYRRVAKY